MTGFKTAPEDGATFLAASGWVVAVRLQRPNIKALRTSLRETQTTFAARFGVDQATVHRWEVYGLPDRGTARVAVENLLASLRDKVG